MAKKKRAGNSYKAQYASYKAEVRYSKNKRAKLKRHIKSNPEDGIAKNCLEDGGFTYKRNRKTDGHICKVSTLHNLIPWNRLGHLPKSAGEQLGLLIGVLISEEQAGVN